ncbi:MAG: ATP synthase subunit I [Anaerolineales bacterium]
MMNETLIFTAMFVAGVILGTIFFGGLWLTVQKGVSSIQPSVWFLLSLIIRMSITVTGFYYLSHGRWQRLLPIVLGFFTARFIIIRIIGKPDKQITSTSKGASHAPQS